MSYLILLILFILMVQWFYWRPWMLKVLGEGWHRWDGGQVYGTIQAQLVHHATQHLRNVVVILCPLLHPELHALDLSLLTLNGGLLSIKCSCQIGHYGLCLCQFSWLQGTCTATTITTFR